MYIVYICIMQYQYKHLVFRSEEKYIAFPQIKLQLTKYFKNVFTVNVLFFNHQYSIL